MSIVLINAEIENIRSHENISFSPATSDLTVISGPNGTGKSTIPNSVAWALFGTKPEGVSSNATFIRHGVKPGKNVKVRARVTIQVDDSTLVIERRIVSKAGSVECDMWEQKEDGELEHLSGPSVSHTEKAIIQRLRMDEKGFLAAVLVQQKQVDALISAPPRERGKIIERLTGISMLTTALDSARQEYNDLKKSASNSEFDMDSLQDAESRLNVIEKAFNDGQKQLTAAKEEAQKAIQALSDAQEKLHDATSLYDSSEERRKEITSLSSSVAADEKHFIEAVKERDAAKKLLPKDYSPEALNEAQDELDTATTAYHSAVTTMKDARKRVESLSNRKIALEEKLSNSKVNVNSVQDAEARIEKAEQKLDNLNEERETAIVSMSGIKSNVQSLKSAITTLEGHGGSCPTCLQSVDDVTTATDALRSQINGLREQHTALKSTVEESDNRIAKGKKLVSTLELALRIIQETENIDMEVSELNGSIDDAEKTARTNKPKISKAQSRVDQLKQSDALYSDYHRIRQRTEKMSRNIDEMNNKLDLLKKDEADADTPSKSEMNALHKKVEKMYAMSSAKTEVKNEILVKMSSWTEQKHNAEKEVSDLNAQQKRYQTILAATESAAGTVDVITDFRANRINNSVPVIESYASDLLQRFTDGEFVSLSIDEKFKVKVTASNGEEMPVGMLSGGELSAAAIALRIAISLLLNGGSSSGTVILDEVLVSQDAERAENILASIKDVCKGQVILIAHNDIASSVADTVFDLSAEKA